jgi:hypothetical protein
MLTGAVGQNADPGQLCRTRLISAALLREPAQRREYGRATDDRHELVPSHASLRPASIRRISQLSRVRTNVSAQYADLPPTASRAHALCPRSVRARAGSLGGHHNPRTAADQAQEYRSAALPLLCTRHLWPRRRAAEKRDELPPPHSITSSARANNVCGTVMPSALAVFRLMTVSYLVGACTGRSDGFSPLRMRST